MSGRDAEVRGNGQRLVVLILTVVVSLLVVLMSGTEKLTEKAEAQNAITPATNGFRVAETSEGKIRGSLDRPKVLKNRFQGEVTTQASGKSSLARVVAGTLVIDAKRDLRTQDVVAGGHGKKITAAQKQTLTKICEEFERSFDPLGTPMSQQKDLLLRSTCYYAEAPVGYELTDTMIRAPRVLSSQTSAAVEDVEFTNVSYKKSQTTSDVTDAPTPEECDRAEVSMDYRTTLACQREGESGIRYLECRKRNYNLYYDSKNPRRCYGFRGNVPTGPCTKRCHGRCGPGCGLFASGKGGSYTRDCAEHDDCIADYDGPGKRYSDRNCGDEFGDADDDFFLARINCRACGRPN